MISNFACFMLSNFGGRNTCPEGESSEQRSNIPLLFASAVVRSYFGVLENNGGICREHNIVLSKSHGQYIHSVVSKQHFTMSFVRLALRGTVNLHTIAARIGCTGGPYKPQFPSVMVVLSWFKTCCNIVSHVLKPTSRDICTHIIGKRV
ncbi:Piso0_005035 [Millerozyma farinosa CBS 7064]|uniref:Piso0_005035 protein n=1 Tax=Pichia sorbitophila (strain ATCC MYA-4447 / BCRC 22081 / CBS 7064 / NBRC 10061 / NRRL Y-12695) TaxID=559304 RepID=G8Y421_PICSO|nr:Piso0_005035 [Millerozyma farinosa CBS 7064]